MDVAPGGGHPLDIDQRGHWGVRDSACGKLRVEIPSCSSSCSFGGRGESCETLSSPLETTHSSTVPIACPMRSTADRAASLVAHAAVSCDSREHGSILSAMSAYSSDNSEPNTPRSHSLTQEPFIFSAVDSPRTRPSLNERRNSRRRNKPLNSPSLSLSLVGRNSPSLMGRSQSAEDVPKPGWHSDWRHFGGSSSSIVLPNDSPCSRGESLTELGLHMDEQPCPPPKLRRGDSVPDLGQIKLYIPQDGGCSCGEPDVSTLPGLRAGGEIKCVEHHMAFDDASSLRKSLARSRFERLGSSEALDEEGRHRPKATLEWFMSRRGDMEGREKQLDLDGSFVRQLEALSIPMGSLSESKRCSHGGKEKGRRFSYSDAEQHADGGRAPDLSAWFGCKEGDDNEGPMTGKRRSTEAGSMLRI